MRAIGWSETDIASGVYSIICASGAPRRRGAPNRVRSLVGLLFLHVVLHRVDLRHGPVLELGKQEDVVDLVYSEQVQDDAFR